MAVQISALQRSGIVLLILQAALGLPVARLAHASESERYRSVHFNSGRPDFASPPRRSSRYVGVDYRPSDESFEDGWNLRDNARQSARAYVRLGRWEKARRAFAWGGNRFGWRGNDRDRWEVLQRAGDPAAWKPAFRAALRTYIEGMALYDAEDWSGAQKRFERVQNDRAAGFLRMHAQYQIASLAYQRGDPARALTLYKQWNRDFPSGSKREAVLIMIARCAILPPGASAKQFETGRDALNRLEWEFPHTRFQRSVARLRGHLCCVSGRYDEALWCYFAVDDLASVEIVRKSLPVAADRRIQVALLAAYLRRLLQTHDGDDYIRALGKVDHIRKSLDPAGAARFSDLLLRDAETASCYLYYRLNHCEKRPADLHSLGRLARRILDWQRRSGQTSLSPLIRLRLAEIYYHQRQYDSALQWSGSVLAGSTPPTVRDRALYVHGGALHRLGRPREALRDFESLQRQLPESPLRKAVREELAILYETVGDLGRALDQYFALGYDTDIAYLIDVRMSLPELEQYFRSRPNGRVTSVLGVDLWDWRDLPRGFTYTEHDLIAYSLGIRYMREERWRIAAQWLRRVPRAKYAVFSKGRKMWEWRYNPNPDPLSTVRELSRLHRAYVHARPGNACAAAEYRYASYYYTRGILLLYNPVLWWGERRDCLVGNFSGRPVTKADRAALRTHMYAHESYARCLNLCVDVARRYPHSPSAPLALYRAACAANRLADFNDWWRGEEAKRRDLSYEASRLMKRVALHYPKHPLAVEARKYAGVFERERLERWARRMKDERLARR